MTSILLSELDGSTVVGRHSECDICLPSEEISRRHARVEVTTDGLYVEDLDSANGTFVNGKRVRRSKIEPGDELKLDTVRFLVQAAGSESAAADNKASKKQAKPSAQPVAVADEEEKSGTSGAVKWAIVLTVVIGGAVVALKFGGML